MSEELAWPEALVVDGDPRVRATLGPALEALGLAMAFEREPAAALARLARRRPSVVLLAFQAGSADGFALMRAMHARCPGLPVLLLVPRGADDCVAQAIREGAADCVGKPIVPEEIRARVSAALVAGAAARDRAGLEALSAALVLSGPLAAVLEGVANAARAATGRPRSSCSRIDGSHGSPATQRPPRWRRSRRKPRRRACPRRALSKIGRSAPSPC